AALVGEVEDVGVEGADLRAVRRVDVAARRAAAPALERDERVTGDLVGEAGAALAQDAAVAVEEDLAGDLQRLGEGPLDVDEAGGRPAVRHRLVLQRALPALVADGAVERVVDEEELDHPVLRLVGDGGGVLGGDDHAGGGLERARGLRLGHRAEVALPVRGGHLDEALAAGAGGLEQGVVAEPRDLDADLLGGPDDERALGHVHLDAVDGDGEEVALLRRRGSGSRRRHRAPTSENTAEASYGKSSCAGVCVPASNSERKCLMPLCIGTADASPSAQKERPAMFAETSRRRSMSVGRPLPASSRCMTCFIQYVPS